MPIGRVVMPHAALVESFNPEPTAKESGASALIRVPTVPAETDASTRSTFAVGSGLNDSDFSLSPARSQTAWRTVVAPGCLSHAHPTNLLGLLGLGHLVVGLLFVGQQAVDLLLDRQLKFRQFGLQL